MTMSTSEEEYVGISEICKEILFVRHILQFLDIKVSYPIIVHCDNAGSIHMTQHGDGKRTKHIDVRYHFVREYVEQGVVKIIFVKSEENLADPYTKNTSEQVYHEHYNGYMKPIDCEK